MTAMKSALSKAGVRAEDVELDIALTKYLNSGGTIERAYDRVRVAADRMSGEGQIHCADDSRGSDAQTRQPVEDARGLKSRARFGHAAVSSPSSSNREGEGHRGGVSAGHHGVALPVREPARPSNTTRGLASITAAQDAIKRGYLIIMKTSDGRPWGKVGWHELDGMGRDGTIAKLIKAKVNPPKNQFAKLDDLMTDAQFTEIYDAARKQIAAV